MSSNIEFPYFTEKRKDTNYLYYIVIGSFLLLIVICIALIPSWVRNLQKSKARFIMKKLAGKPLINPIGNTMIFTLINLGEPGIDVISDEYLEVSDNITQLDALQLLEMSKNKDYVKKKARSHLIKLLSDSEPSVRGKAAKLIGEYDIKEALPYLEKALDSEYKEKWSDTDMELIESKKRRFMSNTFHYECSSCHGNKTDTIVASCKEARIKPWDYTRTQIKKSIDMLGGKNN
ncbi:MAG: HEAT repeat domain-containing protein [Candidatus Eremiobacterota bacterium]